MEAKVADIDNIEISTVRQNIRRAQKMLIKKDECTKPSGGLPADVGTVVNVSTAVAISDAIQKGMPLVERAVSVTGER